MLPSLPGKVTSSAETRLSSGATIAALALFAAISGAIAAAAAALPASSRQLVHETAAVEGQVGVLVIDADHFL